MSQFVLDASVVLTWCFPDEESQKAIEISERIAGGDRVTVPAFWRHEILNALLVGERRKRLTGELSLSFVDDLARLPVDVDEPATSAIVFGVTQSQCRKHRLTACDAAYLELSMRGVTPWPPSTMTCAARQLLKTFRCSECPRGYRRVIG